MQAGRLIWEVVTTVKVRGGSSNQGEKRRGGEEQSGCRSFFLTKQTWDARQREDRGSQTFSLSNYKNILFLFNELEKVLFSVYFGEWGRSSV